MARSSSSPRSRRNTGSRKAKRQAGRKPLTGRLAKRKRVPRTTRKGATPKTADELFAMPESLQELYLLDLEVVGLMRGGLSRPKAMKQLKLTRAQVDRFARSA